MRTLLLCLVLLSAPAAYAEIVDRVVLSVEDEIVTDSDVRLESELCGLDAPALPFWEGDADHALDRLRDAAVVRHLAGDLAVYRPDVEAVIARVETIRSHFDDRASWQAFLSRHGLDEDGIRGAVRSRMVVERYLRRNVAVAPDDPEAFRSATRALIDREGGRLRIREVPRRAEVP